MKPLLICWLLLTAGSVSVAQRTVPEFGIITDEEKKLTECEFDKEADAVILFDQASGDHNDDHNLIVNRHIRIKILKKQGIQRADIEIPYYSKDDFEYISDIKAAVYNVAPNGALKVQSVPNSSIYRKKVSERTSMVSFAMPDVQVGSILEYRYTITSKSYAGLDDWYFQSDIPTLLSSFSLVILPNYEFAYRINKRDDLPITIKQEKDQGKVLLEMSNVAGLRDEPFMDAPRDYIQRVEFQLSGYASQFGGKSRYMTTWEELTRELMTATWFGVQLNKNLSNAGELLLDKVKLLPTPYEKMMAVYHYVYRNYISNGIKTYASQDGVKETWDKKKGCTADINLILINLLKEAGLDVSPLLVSERGHGKVNANYPFLDQFNNVMAYVAIGDKVYVLDAAGPYTPPFMIPFSVINTNAFIVNRKKGKGSIVALEEKGKMDKNQIVINGSLDENGLVAGNATVYSYDYARIRRMRSFTNDKENFADRNLVNNTPGLKIDSLQLENMDNDSVALVQKFHFAMPATSSGEYQLVNLNLFSGYEKNPFISDNRFTNIDYGCLQYHVLTSMIRLPAGMEPETLPKDIRLIMPDTSMVISRMLRYADGALNARYTVQVKRSVYTADDYPAVKGFFTQMTGILNEQVVLKRKKK
jgi:hypothetical protein